MGGRRLRPHARHLRPQCGTLGDQKGRKRVFIIGVALFIAASAACGAATTPLFLDLARAAQGVGGAIMFPVSLAILSQEFRGRERGTPFGIWGATTGLAVAIGPLVGGILTEYAGWRWIFFVNLPIGALCIAGAMSYLHESRDERRGGFDAPGFVFLTGGLFSLVLGLLRGNDWGWGSGKTVGLFVAAIVLLAAFVANELRATYPMLDVRLFRKPAFTGVHIVAFTLSSAMFSQFLYLALYLQNLLKVLAAPSRAPIPAALARLVRCRTDRGTAERAHLLPDPARGRHGADRRRTPADARHHTTLGLDDTSAGFIVGGVGLGTVNAPLASASVSVVEPRQAGMASGTNNTFRQVGIATGIAGLGAILQAKGNFIDGLNAILLVGAFVAFVGALLALVLVRPRDFVRPQQQDAAA
jgi:MFS family permease